MTNSTFHQSRILAAGGPPPWLAWLVLALAFAAFCRWGTP